MPCGARAGRRLSGRGRSRLALGAGQPPEDQQVVQGGVVEARGQLVVQQVGNVQIDQRAAGQGLQRGLDLRVHGFEFAARAGQPDEALRRQLRGQSVRFRHARWTDAENAHGCLSRRFLLHTGQWGIVMQGEQSPCGLRARSAITCTFVPPDSGALRRCKSFVWPCHTARFAPRLVQMHNLLLNEP